MNRRMDSIRVALLVMGSAILLFSCEKKPEADPVAAESIMTEYSEHLSIVMSKNGRRSYHFKAPLVEGYTLAREPYREFRKGVTITTYKDDSLSTVDATLTANYAIYYETRELWEAKGDVVVEKSDGTELYTQQLFWNAKTGKIYSNVDTKILEGATGDVYSGESFESDESFKHWSFNRFSGAVHVDVSRESDSTAVSGGANGADAAQSGRNGSSDGGEFVAPGLYRETQSASGGSTNLSRVVSGGSARKRGPVDVGAGRAADSAARGASEADPIPATDDRSGGKRPEIVSVGPAPGTDRVRTDAPAASAAGESSDAESAPGASGVSATDGSAAAKDAAATTDELDSSAQAKPMKASAAAETSAAKPSAATVPAAQSAPATAPAASVAQSAPTTSPAVTDAAEGAADQPAPAGAAKGPVVLK